jgi:hypothetical protein
LQFITHSGKAKAGRPLDKLVFIHSFSTGYQLHQYDLPISTGFFFLKQVIKGNNFPGHEL